MASKGRTYPFHNVNERLCCSHSEALDHFIPVSARKYLINEGRELARGEFTPNQSLASYGVVVGKA